MVLLLASLVLKLELQERGEALDAAKYSWHIATFYLGAAYAPACASEDGDAEGEEEALALAAGEVRLAAAGGEPDDPPWL